MDQRSRSRASSRRTHIIQFRRGVATDPEGPLPAKLCSVSFKRGEVLHCHVRCHVTGGRRPTEVADLTLADGRVLADIPCEWIQFLDVVP